MADQSRGHPTLNVNISSMLPRRNRKKAVQIGCSSWILPPTITPILNRLFYKLTRTYAKILPRSPNWAEPAFCRAPRRRPGNLRDGEDEPAEEGMDASYVAGTVSRSIELAAPMVLPHGKFVYAATPVFTRKEGGCSPCSAAGCRMPRICGSGGHAVYPCGCPAFPDMFLQSF